MRLFFTIASSLLILISFRTPVLCQNGWQLQNHFAYTGSINDIVQFDMRKIIAVGDYGKIYVSENGGIEMKEISGGSSLHLKALSFVNSQLGFVAGQSGAILKTTDGGYTWIRLNTGLTDSLWDVQALNSNVVFAVGDKSIILKSTDGGLSWVMKNRNTNYYLLAVKFFDSNRGNAVGSNGLILKTDNGGETWYPVSQNLNFTMQLIDIDVKYYKGFAVGDSSRIYRTTDYGLTWRNVDTTYPYYFNARTLYRVKVITDSLIEAVGDACRTSTNGGETFGEAYYCTPTVRGLALSGPDSGFSCGYKFIQHQEAHFTYGGQNLPYNSEYYDYRSVSAIDGNHCWVLSFDFYYCGSQRILFNTTNAGAYWKLRQYPDINHEFAFHGVKFKDKNTGYLIGHKVSHPFLLKTSDGGENWSTVYYDSTIYMAFRDDMLLHGGRIYTLYSGWILNTSNEGQSWDTIRGPGTYQTFTAFNIPDKGNNIFGATYPSFSNTYRSTDGGITWQNMIHYLYNIQWQEVYFLNDYTGFFVGGRSSILKSVDGRSVNVVETGNPDPNLVYNAVRMPDANTVFIAGNDGVIYNSTDGGLNWELQFSGVTTDLLKMDFVNNLTGWIVGENSVILYTTTGGKNWTNNTGVPINFYLSQNFPNPFNPATKIKFGIPSNLDTKLSIYDIIGRRIATLVNQSLDPGNYEAQWNGAGFASGVYFYNLTAGEFSESKKMILIK